MQASEILGQELKLPCGVAIPNRFMKSAMSEVLGSPDYKPTERHTRLYRTWAEGGTGLVVTGNIMVDSRQIGEPGNVVVEDESNLELLKQWAEAGTAAGNHLWVQLNHPGKQTPNFLTKEPVAPSAIPLKLPSFNTPRELTEEEIREIIDRFGKAAGVLKKAGFTGVQIHGAHGYLVSQFLSPQHNQRKDDWGGTIENRMRFPLEVYRSIRAAVGKDFPVGIKLNSADFQRGGFTEEESLKVIAALSEAGVDLIEISGGTYEAPAMTGQKVRESTRLREAYFLTFAEKVREVARAPLAVTGGFRTAKGMIEARESGATDLIGLARPLCLTPDLPNRVLAGEDFKSDVPAKVATGIKALDFVLALDITWYEIQIGLLGEGKQPDPGLNPFLAGLKVVSRLGLRTLKRRRA